jgi:Iron-containing redox enzyme
MSVRKQFEAYLELFNQEVPKDLFKDKEVYGRWLAQTYYFVCHSTPLLGYALPYLKNRDLQHHFEHHLGEEERHDMMAKKDLEKLGYSLSDFPEYSETQAFYQSQYYRINFEGGTSLLGYILFLEGIAVSWGREGHEHIKDLYKGSTLFLKVHAEEDPHHVTEAIKAIESLSGDQQEAILANLTYSFEAYMNILKRIRQEAQEATWPKKKAS